MHIHIIKVKCYNYCELCMSDANTHYKLCYKHKGAKLNVKLVCR